IKRLPVKSLLQFQSVSKGWKSMIDTPGFIASYTGQHQHLLINYYDSLVAKYVSFEDNDTFPQNKVSVTIPPLVNTLNFYGSIGASHGLLCLLGVGGGGGGGRAVIWNPSIRKAVAVDAPWVGAHNGYKTIVGFGVCRETADPKIVKIEGPLSLTGMEFVPCDSWQVEVFTLSTGAWRPSHGNLFRQSIYFSMWDVVVVDGVLYWLASDYAIGTMYERVQQQSLIVSVDMTSKEFGEVHLPDSLAHHSDLFMSKLRESLVVVAHDGVEANNTGFCVWMMVEDDGSRSFTKLFTLNVNTPDKSRLYVKAFRKTGELMIDIYHGVTSSMSLAIYKSNSKSINNVEIMNPGFVCSYMETLLLL
ncbi:putative F-box protein At3g10240, partial [Bidens hawaiensis]|uniref:putative F-box protein At3g10240 n=1 Tax=Bidens hawaiensis TaxID=980011 RepID=UPI00404A124D